MSDQKTFKDVADVVENELAQVAIGLVKRKPKEEKEPSRINLYVIAIAAFLMLTLLDIISGVVVGNLTNILYGLLVVVIGVGALAIAETGYFWAYSSKYQKILSVVDGVIGIASTLLIGMVAAALYSMKAFSVVDISGWKTWLEIGTMVSMVLIGVTHALLWISYVLIDAGVKMYQNYTQGKATNKMRKDNLDQAEESMLTTLAMAIRLQGHARAGKGGLLRQEILNLTGDDLLNMDELNIKPVAPVPTAGSNGNGNHP
jgi:hypothetical protein